HQAVSNFSNPGQGPGGGFPWGVAVLPDQQADLVGLPHNTILVVDNLAGTVCRPAISSDACGELFAVDPGTRNRTLLVNFGDAKGNLGWNPLTAAVEASGTVLVADPWA